MRTGFVAGIVVLLSAGSALAQSGAPSGPGATSGDPAASTATQQTTGAATRSNPSGSGTSTSGGKDDNGDAGRDKMPESDHTVRPLDQQQQHPQGK